MHTAPEVPDLLQKALSGRRLSAVDGSILLEKGELLELGHVANTIRQRLHPQQRVTYIIDRNINYTNVCTCQCRFCAFYRSVGDPDAYILDKAALFEKIEQTLAVGGTELLIQGGLHPALNIDYYVDMLQSIKERFHIHIHSFSPPEIIHLCRKSGRSITEVLARLKDAGLDSLPGGGAEILVDRVRRIISPNKISWRLWMDVMDSAHHLGMKTTATMMFGHVETTSERVMHMVRVREQQDATGGFTAFIPWSFQPRNTKLGGTVAGAVDYLKTVAVARIMLDNIPNIQASWVTQGAKIAQLALTFGANDFGSTMLEENVVRAAGVTYRVPLEEIHRCIYDAGFIPAQRRTDYTIIKEFTDPRTV
ncbi:cyclic dehypoxanthinyl futalosine synthase [Desulfoscipio gibsoniae]|uniref:Cyclic dehypoxanthine futalosine synthase n=1 Tax=Desulfoscipio gibsoniae DSM 7213 TaxID=767817 RepID=R4KEF0_9FIRM|nr:cyclic dehypoxanthinyl futalosine synthase [Desulfoscipio gibsoniae]AGL01548.1 menaquinone biosynthesis protein, SCO4550 family [Desulfoscipio gibsoniae DSM 7213]